MFAVSQFLQFL